MRKLFSLEALVYPSLRSSTSVRLCTHYYYFRQRRVLSTLTSLSDAKNLTDSEEMHTETVADTKCFDLSLKSIIRKRKKLELEHRLIDLIESEGPVHVKDFLAILSNCRSKNIHNLTSLIPRLDIKECDQPTKLKLLYDLGVKRRRFDSLIQVYEKMNKQLLLFPNDPGKNLRLCNALINAWVNRGDLTEALKIFDTMVTPQGEEGDYEEEEDQDEESYIDEEAESTEKGIQRPEGVQFEEGDGNLIIPSRETFYLLCKGCCTKGYIDNLVSLLSVMDSNGIQLNESDMAKLLRVVKRSPNSILCLDFFEEAVIKRRGKIEIDEEGHIKLWDKYSFEMVMTPVRIKKEWDRGWKVLEAFMARNQNSAEKAEMVNDFKKLLEAEMALKGITDSEKVKVMSLLQRLKALAAVSLGEKL